MTSVLFCMKPFLVQMKPSEKVKLFLIIENAGMENSGGL